MAQTTRLVGTVLIVIGVLAYVLTAAASLTALLPALLGVVLLVLGLLARREERRRTAIHIALGVAALGLLGTLSRLVPALFGGDAGSGAALLANAITALVCGIYVVLGIRSFRAARSPARR